MEEIKPEFNIRQKMTWIIAGAAIIALASGLLAVMIMASEDLTINNPLTVMPLVIICLFCVGFIAGCYFTIRVAWKV